MRFFAEIEAALTEISYMLSVISDNDVDRVLLSAEWLLRDVLLIEHLLPAMEANWWILLAKL
jgi:hypothetical protein